MRVGELGLVRRGPELGNEVERVVPVVLCAARRRQPSSEAVDLDAQQADVAEVIGAGGRDFEAAARAAPHEAVALETAQCFADRGAADLEPLGELNFAQATPAGMASERSSRRSWA